MTVGFEQAVIKVENEKEFQELKGAIERVFRPERVEKFLKKMKSRGVRIRDWDQLIAQRVLEQVDEGLAKSGSTAQQFYGALTLSDQAQMREFYLSKLEEVSEELRTKYKKIYQYY
jgi:hypothetical protein